MADSGASGAPDTSPHSDVPCGPTGWTASASLGTNPNYAIDGMPTTRWTTDVPREPGQYFELDFGHVINLRTIELNTELYPLDSPSAVAVSLDATPTPATSASPAPGVLHIELAGKAVRVLRLTANDHGQPVPQFMDQLAWWSIYEATATCDE